MYSKKTEELVKISNELMDLAGVNALLAWDQETYMPELGSEVKSHHLATMAGIYHDKLTKIPKELFEVEAENEWDRALIREMKREYEKATKLPKKLVAEMSEAVSRAFDVWQKARQRSDFQMYVPALERVLDLKVQECDLIKKPGQAVYDVMLDEHEPNLKQVEVEGVFGPVQDKLSMLGKRLTELTKGADKIFRGKRFPIQEQEELGVKALELMGFDFTAGRQDLSAHPFTTNFGIKDVRITTREDESDPRVRLYATIHEGGHALYEQGVNPELERTHLAGGQGLVLHESQSRLWENMVGRSREFLNLLGKEDWVKAVNIVRPSLIRVEADEVTYGLHIIIRFEIEKELVTGKIRLVDLPKMWNEKYKDYLGIEPENDADGVLQDVHWSHGSFGYFPTYLLGTMTAAQIWRKVPPNQDPKELREWLRVNIHQFGKLYTAKELVRKVTGEDLNPNYYTTYLEEKFKKLY